MRLWDVSRPGVVRQRGAPIRDATSRVASVAFGPDDRLATGSDDGVVRLWTIDPQRAAAEVCADAEDPINHAEWDRYVPGMTYRQPCPNA